MKIFNHSALPIDETLWRQVSEALELEGRPRRRKGKAAQLKVIVDVQKSRNGESNSLYGMHSSSKILIYPCRDCTSGTILMTFLHEIMHAWIFLYRPELYTEGWTEDLCEGAAKHLFHLLGGDLLAENTCRRYQIELPVGPLENHTAAHEFLSSFSEMSADQLQKFGTEHMAQ